MKNISKILLVLLTSTFMNNAQAAFEGPNAPSVETTTVQKALSMSDETPVVLTGKIINNLGDEKYTFKDATGEIVVEIDDEDWRGLNVTPENTVEIRGEIDKDFYEKAKIDVDMITIK